MKQKNALVYTLVLTFFVVHSALGGVLEDFALQPFFVPNPPSPPKSTIKARPQASGSNAVNCFFKLAQSVLAITEWRQALFYPYVHVVSDRGSRNSFKRVTAYASFPNFKKLYGSIPEDKKYHDLKIIFEVNSFDWGGPYVPQKRSHWCGLDDAFVVVGFNGKVLSYGQLVHLLSGSYVFFGEKSPFKEVIAGDFPLTLDPTFYNEKNYHEIEEFPIPSERVSRLGLLNDQKKAASLDVAGLVTRRYAWKAMPTRPSLSVARKVSGIALWSDLGLRSYYTLIEGTVPKTIPAWQAGKDLVGFGDFLIDVHFYRKRSSFRIPEAVYKEYLGEYLTHLKQGASDLPVEDIRKKIDGQIQELKKIESGELN